MVVDEACIVNNDLLQKILDLPASKGVYVYSGASFNNHRLTPMTPQQQQTKVLKIVKFVNLAHSPTALLNHVEETLKWSIMHGI